MTNFLRGIPEFLVLLVIYFGGTQVLGERARPDVEVSPFGAGLIALVARSSAPMPRRPSAPPSSRCRRGRSRRGAPTASPAWQCFRLIQLPQIWKVAIPGLGNLWQGAVKDTALVSIVGLDDLMRKSNQAAQSTREPFTFYLARLAHVPR